MVKVSKFCQEACGEEDPYTDGKRRNTWSIRDRAVMQNALEVFKHAYRRGSYEFQ